MAFLTAGLLALYGLAEVLIDPFGVFGIAHFNRRNFEPNVRYGQIEYLRHHSDFDGFVLGSSRANILDVGTLDRLSGHRYYNLGAPAQNITGIYQEVRWLLAHERVHDVVLALDYDYFEALNSDWDLPQINHPEVSGDSRPAFLAKYLLVPFDILQKCVRANFQRSREFEFDAETGQFHNYVEQRRPLSVPPGWLAQLVSGENRRLDDRSAYRYLRATLRLLDEHGVRRHVLIDPVSSALLQRYDPAEYFRWTRQVVGIAGEVWDFGTGGSVTANDKNFADFSHFRKYIGDWMLGRVFAPALFTGPRDFGSKLERRPRWAGVNLEEPLRAGPIRDV
jgi:hypothetical protein